MSIWVDGIKPVILMCNKITIAHDLAPQFIQRYVFRDKRVGWSNIKNQFKEAFKKDINERKRKWKYKDLAMRTKKGS